MNLVNNFNAPIYEFEILDSTNKFAKDLCNKNPKSGTIIIAKEQTNGRGRLGNTWESQKDNGLYYSIVFKKSDAQLKYETLTLFICLSITRLLEEYSISSYIKWPNDILISGKKVCGILSESTSTDFGEFIIIGIGINLYHKMTDFSQEIKNKATSLNLNTTRKINRTFFINSLTDYIFQYYNHFLMDNFENFLLEYTNKSFLVNKKINLNMNGQEIQGIVNGFDKFGRLILKVSQNKSISINSGEISLENIYKNSGRF